MKTLLSLCLPALLFVFSSPTLAADFTVNLTTDEFDANFSDGICDIDLATPGEQCTLRAALNEAGFNNSDDTIGFSVTGEITLTTDESLFIFSNTLNSTESLTINGPGANSLIINGNNLGTVVIDNTINSTTINNLTITGGAPGQFTGGGGVRKSFGTLSLSNVIITGNKTNFGGGGIAFSLGTLIITDSTISNNEAGSGGGVAFGAGTLTITDSTISDNDAASGGGGVFIGGQGNIGATVTITDTSISGNTAETFGGGGVLLFGPSTATISNSTISSNVGLCGGGIVNGGTLNLSSSAVNNNIATSAPDSTRIGCAGGIGSGGTLNLTNSTVSGNQVLNGNFNGGGIGLFGGTASINNSTIAHNLAAGSISAGGVFSATGTQVGNTIIAANQNNTVTADVRGFFNSRGGNLIGNVGDAFGFFPFLGDQAGGNGNPIIDPLLGPLADNGGPTFTHALLAGSPAIDAGRNDLTTATFDQRSEGFPRIVDGNNDGTAAVDIGAFEVQIEPSPAELIEDLIEKIKSYDPRLPHGIETSLIAKLENALADLAAGNTPEALDKLGAFINQVQALSGKTISRQRAEELITEINRIMAAINSGQ